MMHIGYYGKLQHRGDFVRFNLPKTFINVWDDWLQQLLLAAEELHGTQWGSVYNNCDSYRFALDANLAGMHAWTGLMFPGIDKVGRRFPFCIAAQLPVQIKATMAIGQLENWYTEVEIIARQALNDNDAYTALQQTLGTLAEQGYGVSLDTEPLMECDELAHDRTQIGAHIADNRALTSADNAQVLIHSLLAQTIGQYSIWSSLPSNSTIPTTVISHGLPVGNAGIALFDRNWSSTSFEMLPTRVLAEAIPSNLIQTDLPVGAKFSEAKIEESSTAIENIATSTGDWSALETDEEPTFVPECEKLELDDDLAEKPWE